MCTYIHLDSHILEKQMCLHMEQAGAGVGPRHTEAAPGLERRLRTSGFGDPNAPMLGPEKILDGVAALMHLGRGVH